MENEETVEQRARRETLEEAQAELHNLSLYTMLSIPRISQVYIMFRANLSAENAFSAGDETLEAHLFTEQEIPWKTVGISGYRT